MDEKDFKKIAQAAAVEVRDTYSVPKYFTQAEVIEILRNIKKVSASQTEKVA